MSNNEEEELASAVITAWKKRDVDSGDVKSDIKELGKTLRYMFFALGGLVLSLITVGISDHYGLVKVKETVEDNKVRIKTIEEKVDVIWYGGEWHKK